jgi:murein DD-endopeptidase MepM/ murein hydrolase activator NlpD
VAVASGVVVRAGYAGDSGNMVVLKHAGGYETYYLHLSSITRGLRPGTRVGQGEIIGRVGKTGLATAPHLDYRLRRNGQFVNPIVEHANMPPGPPIPAEFLSAFFAERDRALARLVGVAARTPPPTARSAD